MKKDYNKSKGITLVALTVTLIILLILAGISIASLTGNGLFEKAKLAKEKQANAQIEEDEILGDYENKIENITGTVRDFGTSKVLYKLNNPTWEAVPSAELNDDVTKYKLLRIDFISCWWDNTVQPILIENIWVEPSDLNIGISCSLNLANWYIYNTFKFNNNTFIINSSINDLYNGYSKNNQTANIYRVVGYN